MTANLFSGPETSFWICLRRILFAGLAAVTFVTVAPAQERVVDPDESELPALFEIQQLLGKDGQPKKQFEGLAAALDGGSESARVVKVNFDLLISLNKDGPTKCKLWKDNPRVVVELVRDPKPVDANTFLVKGKVDGVLLSELRLLVRDRIVVQERNVERIRRLVGNVYDGDKRYDYRYLGDSLHIESVLSDGVDGPPHPEPSRPKSELPKDRELSSSPTPRDFVPDEPVIIDFAVFFTAKAKENSSVDGDLDNIEMICQKAVLELDQTLLDSQTRVSARVVHVGQTTDADFDEGVYTGPHAVNDCFTAFWAKSDGILDDIHATRACNNADICFLVTDTENWYPVAHRMRKGDNHAGFWELAFGMGHWGKIQSDKSFSHEVGHLFGCCHAGTTRLPLFDFAFPHFHSKNGVNYTTMLGVADVRLPYFSNPDISIDGELIGAEYENNAKTIRETAPIVKGFSGPH